MVPPPPGEAERLRAVDLVGAYEAGGRLRVRVRPTGRERTLEPDEAEVLRRARDFATVDEHVRALAGAFPPERARRLLRRLRRKGLLWSEADWIAAMRRQAAEAAPPPLRAFALVTGNRERLAARFVEAWGDRPGALHVFEDGRDLAGGAAEARARRLVAPRPGSRFTTRADRAGYARRLAERAGLPPELLAWALLGEPRLNTSGATRNAALLDLLDEPLALFDDDVLPLAWRPRREPGVALFTGGDPTRFSFPDPAIARRMAGERFDLLGAWSAFLGRPVAAVLGAGPVDLSAAEGATLSRAATSPVRVGFVQAGLVGDPGMGSPHHLLRLEGPSRDAMAAGYPETVARRSVARLPPGLALGEGGVFMTYAVALDAEAAALPFFPHGRNGDGAWGMAQRETMPHLWRLWVPEALGHLPEPPRRWDLDAELDRTGGWLLTDLLVEALTSRGFQPGAPPELRREHLGRRLVELGELPPGAFEEFWRVRWLDSACRCTVRAEEYLDRYRGEPAAWAAHLRRALDAVRRRLADRDGHLLPELLAFMDADATRAFARDQVRLYGELLLAWPAVLEAARALRAEGVRPSRLPDEASPPVPGRFPRPARRRPRGGTSASGSWTSSASPARAGASTSASAASAGRRCSTRPRRGCCGRPSPSTSRPRTPGAWPPSFPRRGSAACCAACTAGDWR